MHEQPAVYGSSTNAPQSNPESVLVLTSPDSENERKPIPWAEIEKAAVAGVLYSELSRIHNVPEVTIRSRASRYSWPVSYKRGPINPVKPTLATKQSNEAVKAVVDASLEQIAQDHPLRLARYASSKLAETFRNDLLPAPSNWKEANTADTMLRRSLGLDKPQVVQQTLIWSGSPTQSQAGRWEDEGEDIDVRSDTETGEGESA